MPVNTAALKTFAPGMRRQLLEAVGRKLDLLLNSQTPDTLSTYATQISELRDQEAENRDQLLERVAYTWFNRLCALRYLDARGWHPFGCKVLMPAGEGETQPELLKLMRAGSLPTELQAHTNEARLHGLLDGQIPPAMAGSDPQREVYRELVLASCRSYHLLLPELFEGLDDASELLLPDDLLSEGSIAGGFRIAISDTDCEDVEIIGWLYQFYISEKKDQVIGKVVKSEDIPAATQLFTPNWIVKYMVQNSLGATWLATYPDSPLKGKMEFYIEPAEQTPEVNVQLAAITPESLDPEELTLIDPACGSGHILVEAYDLLKAIYLERGYRQRDIPVLILTKNLFGLDICPRAVQMATFSLLMKGREDDRKILDRGIRLNVIILQDCANFNVEYLAASMNLPAGITCNDVQMLAETFTQASTFGSLIEIPHALFDKLPALHYLSEQSTQDVVTRGLLEKLGTMVQQAAALTRKYDVVVANPPYLSNKAMSAQVKSFMKTQYEEGQRDVFAAFLLRCIRFSSTKNSFIGLVVPFSWMYLSTFEALRSRILRDCTIESLVELETNAFEPAMVTVCSFTLSTRSLVGNKGCYIRLSNFKGGANQAPRTLEAIRERDCGWFFETCQDSFRCIPGTPLAYWLGDGLRSAFSKGVPLKRLANPKQGLSTADTSQFLRRWHEVSMNKINTEACNADEARSSGARWFPHSKGGGFRRWFGNNEWLIDWEDDGARLRRFEKAAIRNSDSYFLGGISWSDVTSSLFNARRVGRGFAFDTAGPTAVLNRNDDASALHAFMNTRVFQELVSVSLQGLHYNNGTIGSMPVILDFPNRNRSEEIEAELYKASVCDWDAFERSWNFRLPPLLAGSSQPTENIESRYSNWVKLNCDLITKFKGLEEENNSLFIEAYGLQDELSPEVPIEQISLTVNPPYRYGGNLSEDEQWCRFRRDTIAEFLSYATGCMMGRYSLDDPGLILADSRDSQAAHLAAYEAKVGKPLSAVQFKPDPDAIIPLLDGEWFEDDIVARTREFLEVTFPESTITENLRFIEESLGKDIHKYFCTDFYKDHLQTYKKRPIYWMVQSPAGPSRGGFACLIYLHRYTKDTLNQVLNNYFRPYLQKLEARLAQLGLDQLNDSLPTRERTAARKDAEKITKVLKECQAWEQDALLPLAQQRIELDLDDGVKVNYLKLQDVLATIPGLAAKED